MTVSSISPLAALLYGSTISSPLFQTVPARRYEPSLRDETTTSDGKYFGIDDSRWQVRQDAVNPWLVNDVFTDEEGQRRRVVGVRHLQQQGHVAGALIELIGSTA